MSTVVTLESSHRLFYDAPVPVTASMLAESLLGLEGVLKRSTEVLAVLLETRIKETEVLITSIQLGSYDENFWVRLVFGKGKSGERSIEKLRKKLGLKEMNLKTILGVIAAAAVGYVAYQHATASGDKKATIHIENSFNTWGGKLGMTGEDLRSTFDGSIRNKDDLRKQVIRLTHPDGIKHSGKMTFDDDLAASVPSEVLQAIPSDYVRSDDAEPFSDQDNVDLVIRAVDLDRPSNGWAAIVPTVSDKRLPLQIAEGIDPLKIPIGRYTKADLTVVFKVDRFGNKTPKRYQLRKWLPPLSEKPTAEN